MSNPKPLRIVYQDKVLKPKPDITPLESTHLAIWLACGVGRLSCDYDGYLIEHNLMRHFVKETKE